MGNSLVWIRRIT